MEIPDVNIGQMYPGLVYQAATLDRGTASQSGLLATAAREESPVLGESPMQQMDLCPSPTVRRKRRWYWCLLKSVGTIPRVPKSPGHSVLLGA